MDKDDRRPDADLDIKLCAVLGRDLPSNRHPKERPFDRFFALTRFHTTKTHCGPWALLSNNVS
jgi:hypothetical protein